MNKSKYPEDTLQTLYSPQKSRLPLIVGIGAALLFLLLVAGSILIAMQIQKIHETETAGMNDMSNAPSAIPTEPSGEANLIPITGEQAKIWLQQHQAELNVFTEEVKTQPNLESVWLETATNVDERKIYGWINDATVTADAQAAKDNPDVLLFSDVLMSYEVPVTSFYSLVDKMKGLELAGYELFVDTEGNINGLEAFHQTYDGSFYYSFKNEPPAGESVDLGNSWWYIE